MQYLKIVLILTGLSLSIVSAHAEFEEYQPEPISQGELEQLLAPIALYPDTVLSHILIAATYPLEVVQAERWLQQNPTLKGSEAVAAAESKEWDPSVRALLAFPEIMKRLSRDLDWTQKLGEAFIEDEEQVLASVQSLRQLASDAGNLDKLEKLSVSREDDAILIEPVEREVIYIPYYDTRTVYGPWRWSGYDPVYWDCPYHVHYRGYDRHSSVAWGPRVSVSFGYAFSSLHWRNRHITRIPYNYYRPRQYYYTNREINRHDRAQRWEHNPRHRRGVTYRNAGIRGLEQGHANGARLQTDESIRSRQHETRRRIREMSVDQQARRRATINSQVPGVRTTINQRNVTNQGRTQAVNPVRSNPREVNQTSVRERNNALVRDRTPSPSRAIDRAYRASTSGQRPVTTPQVRQTQRAVPNQRVTTPAQTAPRQATPPVAAQPQRTQQRQSSQRSTSNRQSVNNQLRQARRVRPDSRLRRGMQKPD